MLQKTNQIFFALLRSAICGTKLTNQEKQECSPDKLNSFLKLALRHDVAHLLIWGLKQNGLILQNGKELDKYVLKAIYRYELIKNEYEKLCKSFEEAQISFLPLKGMILRKYYPEVWMRTSCDIDVLIHREQLDKIIAYLSKTLNYVEKERATHDVALLSPTGVHIEIHFDLVEEGRANNAIDVLSSVWDNAILSQNSKYLYEMPDEFFYVYHIAHMAKHFENGGCGIRPFIDLWILDHLAEADKYKRDELLSKANLLPFADSCRTLSEVWFGKTEINDLTCQMQEFLLHGGVYGSTDNRVAIQQKKRGGRIGYLFSRIFIPYAKLKRYYPILEKHRWLMPLMQVRRWFMLMNPEIAKMAKKELEVNAIIEETKAEELNHFLNNIGLK
ncbi:MAG: hypothetical protein E7582_04735 [Ruminococcaceae bacterium]|nr:hypothetical protein [Oscillospiraceae bacterium]